MQEEKVKDIILGLINDPKRIGCRSNRHCSDCGTQMEFTMTPQKSDGMFRRAFSSNGERLYELMFICPNYDNSFMACITNSNKHSNYNVPGVSETEIYKYVNLC